MPKDLLHGIPVFALGIVFLIVMIIQLLYAKRAPKSDAGASADAFTMKSPIRYAVLYGVLTLFCVAIPVAFAVLALDSIFLYVLGGVMIVFSAGELYGALRRRITFAHGKFSVRAEFGGEEEYPLSDIAEIIYKKNFWGETIKAFGAEGKLFEADLMYRNFEYLKVALAGAGLIQGAAAGADATIENQDGLVESADAETAPGSANEAHTEEKE